MAFKMKGFTPYNKLKDEEEEEKALGKTDVADYTAVKEDEDGNKYVHSLTEKETYEDEPFDAGIKRDTIRVSPDLKVGELVDEEELEKRIRESRK